SAMNPLNKNVMLIGWGTAQNFVHPRLSKSIDAGISWGEPKWQAPNNKGYIRKIAYANSDTSYLFAGLCWDYLLLKSTDAGEHWQDIGGPPAFLSITDIAIHPQNKDILYVCDGGGNRVYLSTNGGLDWMERSGSLPSDNINRLKMDPTHPGILYAGYTGTWYGIWKTTDAGNNWVYSGLGQHDIYDLIIDPEEPTILYAATYDGIDCQVFMSVDRASEWFDISQGLPNKPVFNFGIDPASPNVTFGANLWGAYFYAVPFNKSLVSSSDTATSYNNSRKMVRVENTDEIWITYETGEVIYVVRSTNAGGSWSRKMEVGEGCHPAIYLNPGDNLPCLVWRGLNGRSIYFSRYDGAGWTAPFLLFEDISFTIGLPSFTIDNIGYGHIIFNTYETTDRILYGVFSIYEPWPITPSVLDSGEPCGLTSIDFMLDYSSLHATWAKQGAVYYNFCDASGWHDIEQVSGFEGGSYPSLQVNGSCADITYIGFGAGGFPDIYFRYTYHYPGGHWWSEIWNVSNTMDVSLYPTLSGLNITWTERVDANSEIFLSRFDPVSGSWRPPVNISSSPNEKSGFSHMVLRQTLTETRYYLTWTEKNQAPYDITFKTYIPPQEPDQPLYVADAGQENPGPFCIQRIGFSKYGKESYKTIDYDSDYLYYKMGKFNPKRPYKIEGIFYHENSQNSELLLEIDGRDMGRITVPPKTMKRLKAQIPAELYQDSIIYAKTKSLNGNAVLGVLIAYEYEQPKVGAGSGGGAQSVESNLLITKDFAISNSPNPFQKITTIRYQLPVNCRVSLEVYDACGKLIKRLAEGERKAGYYSLTWDGKDGKGNSLASGIYFYKMKAGNFNQTKKLILLK
ncbi:MAG: FlgD immunoglobulin-like domain containing protein, partial [Halobacteria archaeon]